MTLAQLIKNQLQIKYVRAYLSARRVDGTYNGWTDISKYITDSGIGSYSRSIDTDNFDIGFYEESNMSLTVDNSKALFEENMGFFANRLRDRSKVKLVVGYYDPDSLVPETPVMFEGIIEDMSTNGDIGKEELKFKILSYSSIIRKLSVVSGVIVSSMTFEDALYYLLLRSEITELLTIDRANITCDVNELINNPDWFTGKQSDEAINKLMLAGNAVIKIKDNIVKITPRTESTEVRFNFLAKTEKSPTNVISIKNINSGLRRVFTRVTINENLPVDAEMWKLDKFGARLKTVDIGFTTDTDVHAKVALGILNEFSVQKMELELTTDYLADEIDLLDKVTIDNEGYTHEEDPARYGVGVYGESTYVDMVGGIKIYPNFAWKVLKISHNPKTYITTLKLRRIGSTISDGFITTGDVYGEAVYDEAIFS